MRKCVPLWNSYIFIKKAEISNFLIEVIGILHQILQQILVLFQKILQRWSQLQPHPPPPKKKKKNKKKAKKGGKPQNPTRPKKNTPKKGKERKGKKRKEKKRKLK